MTAFNYSIDDSNPNFYKVIFSGQIRSGEQLASESFSKVLKNIKKESLAKIIIIDLNEVFYWDSEGMRKILSLVENINRDKPLRASILGFKGSKNFERANEKYPIGSKIIPWVESLEELIEMMNSQVHS